MRLFDRTSAIRRGLLAAAVALVVAGCGVADSTENEVGMTIVNRLPSRAAVGYCKTSACTSTWWTDDVDANSTSQDSVNAPTGSTARFVVTTNGRRLCTDLRFTPATPRLVLTRDRLRRCPPSS